MTEGPANRLSSRIAAVGSGARQLADLEVAAIADEMTTSSFSPECAWTTFSVEEWQDLLDASNPDFLFVESAWLGNNGSWQYRIGSYDVEVSVGLPDLRQIVTWARQRKIPTVFWNKEDPVHFDLFAQAACLFDVVLTSDATRIEAYRGLPDLTAREIRALPFAAQPELHNPTEIYGQRIRETCFAGTYYGTRHEARREQLEMLLDGAKARGLRIYDRMAATTSEAFRYPDRFQEHIVGAVPYSEMVRLYRRYRAFLNTNSVTESPTMFSRRVFELLASGTPVVSTPSVGMEAMFGDIVSVVRTEREAAEAVAALLDDDEHWRDVSTAGIRRVLGEHTYRHRLQAVCDAIGIATRPAYDDSASVISTVPTTQLMASISEQRVRPKEVVIARAERSSADLDRLSNALSEIALVAHAVPRTDISELAKAVTSSHCVILTRDGAAPRDLLGDLLLSRRFSPKTVAGAALRDTDEMRPTRHISAGTMIVSTDAVIESGSMSVTQILDEMASGGRLGFGMRNDGSGWPSL